MCFFKKRGNSLDKIKEDRELIATNASFINVAIEEISDSQEFKEKLAATAEQLKYLRPSDKSQVVEYDKSINKQIISLKRALVASDGKPDAHAEEILKEIKVVIADRNAIL
ncbi:MAG: hypothetical protein OSJ74_07280 [Clostridia bacterium]|nr:hypothetical protein [Clostridia bacterium]